MPAVENDAPLKRLPTNMLADLSERMYKITGIVLGEPKRELVEARLAKRLRILGLQTYDEYIRRLDSDTSGQELTALVDALTTNKTSFFREAPHFEFLRREICPNALQRRGPFRLWSAGCSTGEEPYSLALVIREELIERGLADARVLATDISTRVLAVAKEGAYSEEELASVPMPVRQRLFRTRNSSGQAEYVVLPEVSRLIRFARLNLMGSWPMRGPFDAIFCRNVMIYFDRPTQAKLVGRFLSLLKPGGYLFVGLAESLTGIQHGYRFVQPGVYGR